VASCTADGVPAKSAGNAATKCTQDAPLAVKTILLEALRPRAGILLSLGVVPTWALILLSLGGILLVLLRQVVLTLWLLLIVGRCLSSKCWRIRVFVVLIVAVAALIAVGAHVGR